MARQCYVTSCQSKNKEALIIEDLREDTKMQRGEPVEDLMSIEVYPGEENKMVCIGSNLKENNKLELVNLLRTYADIFAWTAADMLGIDPEIITHRLNKSFEELKAHLSSPPLLSKPFPGEYLLIYLSVTEVAVSAVLIREEDGVQKPIYYVSKVLQDVETRYPKIDKIALALIISARRLRPYFQSHTIVVLTDQPLRKVLMSPEASGRLVNWSVELGEFDLWYKPRTAVKAQALADFIVECTLPKDPPQLVISEVTDPWNLYVDGSSAVGNSGAEIILISPEVAHPQSNGQIENMNRSILQGLKKKLNEAKGAWVDELPKVLWAYRTTPHSVTGETPFSLCYGTEAMLPVEIGVPTIRALHFSELNNDVGLRANLDLLEEARTQAHFNEGDLVLRKLEVSNPKAATGKLSPNWEGPYRVIKVLKTGAYALGTLSGESIPRTWNAENLRRYYQ
ncbi:hypothetical protein RJ639_038156 [Escallonia herrerae]|uniref:Reverse transcriptase RNase H-like domain-containing protein n=1 Tax=Escallonia herrerae TaxID=1293975 RepID=A0AA89B616_9ASTE|nr:hypothetical protein RJ639_038156 [Escallonia herrerae]